jgi:hypothetical protein
LPFSGQESCEQKPLSCACCRRCAIATAVPPTFCPHTPPPGRGPIFPDRISARALARTRVRSSTYVPNQHRRAVPCRSPFFVPLPSARHQFLVAAMAVPSAFDTHTNACNGGVKPLLHLSVTVSDTPSCRRREPQRTGARVSVEPSTPSSNPFGHLDPEHRVAQICSLCSCLCVVTVHAFRVTAVATPLTSAQMQTHTPEGSNPSALPVQPVCARPPG